MMTFAMVWVDNRWLEFFGVQQTSNGRKKMCHRTYLLLRAAIMIVATAVVAAARRRPNYHGENVALFDPANVESEYRRNRYNISNIYGEECEYGSIDTLLVFGGSIPVFIYLRHFDRCRYRYVPVLPKCSIGIVFHSYEISIIKCGGGQLMYGHVFSRLVGQTRYGFRSILGDCLSFDHFLLCGTTGSFLPIVITLVAKKKITVL
jgi:hypothetical protein